MRYIFALILCLGFLLPSGFTQNTVNSQVNEVIVFSNQALITRKATVEIPHGLAQLYIETGAFNVDPASIGAKVYGKGEIRSVQFREIYLTQASQEKIRDMIKKLEGLKDKKASLTSEREVLAKKEKFLNSLIDFAQTQVPEEIKTDFPSSKDLKEALNFLSEGYAEIDQKAISLSQNLREIEKEIAAAEKELDSLQGRGQHTKKIIEIAFDSAASQKISIDATYLAYDAYWMPAYKVDVPLELEALNLTMFSQIKQKTGEDWKEVKLSISNVIPLRGASLPQVESWLLDIQRYEHPRITERPQPAEFLQEKVKMSYAASPGKDIADEEGKEAEFSQAVQKELPLSFEYAMPQPVSIASADKETTLPLFSKNLKGDFFYYAAPRVSPLVFLTSRIIPDKELLAGPLNVYFAGRFVGKTNLSEKKAGESFDINLGADREVTIKREKLKDKVQETFFKKFERQTVMRNLAFKITAENRKNKPVDLHLVDALPVSKTDRIEVKDILITPQPDKVNYLDKEGLNLWMVKLQPQEKKEITFEFTITYPKDMPPAGL